MSCQMMNTSKFHEFEYVYLYIYMYVCMYVYMYICICVYIVTVNNLIEEDVSKGCKQQRRIHRAYINIDVHT